MPHSRAMPGIGAGCHELRIIDDRRSWRIVYHVAEEAIVILHVFEKKGRKTSKISGVRSATNRIARRSRARTAGRRWGPGRGRRARGRGRGH